MQFIILLLACSLVLANVVGGDALAPLSAKRMTLIERRVIINIASASFLMFGTYLRNAGFNVAEDHRLLQPRQRQQATPEHASSIENQPAPA